MKRVLSLGDVCVTNDDDGDSAAFTQVKRQQREKSKKTAMSTVQTQQSVSVSESASQPEKSSQALSLIHI